MWATLDLSDVWNQWRYGEAVEPDDVRSNREGSSAAEELGPHEEPGTYRETHHHRRR